MINITTLQELGQLLAGSIDAGNEYVFSSLDQIDLEGTTIIIPEYTDLRIDGTIKNGTIKMKLNSSLLGIDGAIGEGSSNLDNVRVEIEGIGVTISNLSITNTSTTCIYSTYNCSGLCVHDCELISSTKNCIKIVADNIKTVDTNIEIRDCNFTFGRMGIELQNHKNTSYKIDNVLITKSNDPNASLNFTALTGEGTEYHYGISLTGYGKNVTIENATFTNCTKSIEIVGFSDVDISDVTITNPGEYSIISSNSRQMDNIKIHDCTIGGGKLMLYNTIDSIIRDNIINCSYVEIKNSHSCCIYNNTITSSGHYSIMFNSAFKNYAWDNNITQTSDNNYAIIRCYGSKSTHNHIAHNNIVKQHKGGKTFDQYSGATDNYFTNDEPDFLEELDIDIMDINKSNNSNEEEVTYEINTGEDSEIIATGTSTLNYKKVAVQLNEYYVPMYFDHYVIVPEGVCAYPICSVALSPNYIPRPGLNNGWTHGITFDPGSVIPANTGVVLKVSSASANYAFLIVDDGYSELSATEKQEIDDFYGDNPHIYNQYPIVYIEDPYTYSYVSEKLYCKIEQDAEGYYIDADALDGGPQDYPNFHQNGGLYIEVPDTIDFSNIQDENYKVYLKKAWIKVRPTASASIELGDKVRELQKNTVAVKSKIHSRSILLNSKIDSLTQKITTKKASILMQDKNLSKEIPIAQFTKNKNKLSGQLVGFMKMNSSKIKSDKYKDLDEKISIKEI